MQTPTTRQKIAAVIIFIVSLALSFGILFIRIDPNQLAAYGYGGIFVITFLGGLTLFISGPTLLAAFIIGSVLNPVLVSIFAGLGSAFGETSGYAAGYATRALITTSIERLKWYQRIVGWMTRYPFLTIFVVAAIPNFLTDISGLIAGRIAYPYPLFLLATFLGKTIRFGLGAFLGAAIGLPFFRR